MCGRFAFFAEKDELEEIFPGIEFEFWPGKRYNVAPGQDLLAIIHSGKPIAKALRWGLVPAWAKDPAIGNKMINARAETISSKPSFKKPFLQKRCAFPASGFYEWKREGNKKIPHFIRFSSGKLMLFAGLFEYWKKPDGSILSSGTIITRPAIGAYASIHDRMPAILRYDAIERWLAENDTAPAVLEKILEEIDGSAIEIIPVSFAVNSPANDDPHCIQPI